MKTTLDWSFEMGGLWRTRSVVALLIDAGNGSDVAVRTAFVDRSEAKPRVLCAVTRAELNGDNTAAIGWAPLTAPSLEDVTQYNIARSNPRRLVP